MRCRNSVKRRLTLIAVATIAIISIGACAGSEDPESEWGDEEGTGEEESSASSGKSSCAESPLEPRTGAPCTKSADCGYFEGEPLSCMLDDFPGGYCALPCSFKDTKCPPGTVCRNVTYETQACYRGCFNAGDCRPGYVCTHGICSTPKPEG